MCLVDFTRIIFVAIQTPFWLTTVIHLNLQIRDRYWYIISLSTTLEVVSIKKKLVKIASPSLSVDLEKWVP